MVDDHTLAHLTDDSRLWRATCATAAAVMTAWTDSVLRRALAQTTGALAILDPERRVRFAALTLAWACAWHLAAGAVLPRYVASGLPWWWTVAGIAAASLVAVLARPMVRAWDESALANVLLTRTPRN